MSTLDLVLYLIAAGCFAAAAANAATRINLVALGLLAWVLVPLIAVIQAK